MSVDPDDAACHGLGLHRQITVFNLVLPRLLAGERLDERDPARFALGGLCLNCRVCRYPARPMGKPGL